MKDRIRLLMESMHMNQQTFANHIQLSTATLSSILLGRTKPTLNTVEAIQTHCPTVNLSWLINGLGDMYVTPDSTLGSNDQTTSISTGSNQISNEDGDMDIFSSVDNNIQPDARSSNMSLASSSGPYHREAQSVLRVGSSALSTGNHSNGRTGALTAQQHSAQQQARNIDFSTKNIDKYTRHITEIRVYYDDQTWETFVPKKQ